MEQIAINILPKGAKPVCHSSQFDEGRQIRFNLFNDATPYTLSGTETISVLVRKPDGTEVIDSVTNTSDSYVIWEVSTDACELSGVCECELSIVENGILLGSKNFTMKVEEDAYGGKNIEVRTASGRIATFETNMVAPFNSLKTDINPVQDLHGYTKPWSGGAGKNKYCDIFSQYTQPNDYRVFPITLTQGQTYKLWASLKGSAVSGCVVAMVKDGTQYSNFVGFTQLITSSGSINTVPSFTVDETFTNPKLVIYASTETAFNSIFANYNVQLEQGSTATAYEPYSNICPISGFSALSVTRTGVNLGNFQNGYGIDASGNIVVQANRVSTVTPIIINPSLSYYVKNVSDKRFIYAVFKDNTLIRRIANVMNGALLDTTNGNKLYVCLYDNVTVETDKPMVVFDNAITTYEPYNGQTATVNFGQEVFGGVVDVTNGKVTITHGIVDLGSLSWTKDTTTLSVTVFRANIGDRKGGSTDFICTNYEALSGDRGLLVNNNNAIATWNTQASQNVAIRDDNLSSGDATAFKTAMSGVMLCYELATPIEISTTPETLSAIVGQNNVFSDTNGDTEVEYYIEV